MATKTTLPQLTAAAEQIGCTVEVNGERYETIEVLAPAGKHFASGPHSVVCEVNEWSPRADALALLLDDVKRGLVECSPDCECRDA